MNGSAVEVLDGSTVLQACEKAGVTVPRFCYHAHLSIAGNCRRCLVEVEKSPKLQVSCALPARAGRVVSTDTTAVRKAREGVREFLLVNHPLDCPICDQGGECDLQDQALAFGSDHGRFREYKRAVRDKSRGPLIKTIRTRCIHCTRCVRFASEVAGVQDLGTIGRGNNLEIARSSFDVSKPTAGRLFDLEPGLSVHEKQSFVTRGLNVVKTDDPIGCVPERNIDHSGHYGGSVLPGTPVVSALTSVEARLDVFASSGALNSNLTGNLPDVCPVGALTSLPYSFKARPWELKKVESYDLLSPERSPVRFDLRGVGPSSLLRVLPRTVTNTVAPWIGDKSRYGYEGRSRQRVSSPLVPVDDILASCSWHLLFRVQSALYFTFGSNIERRFGPTTNRETLVAGKAYERFYWGFFAGVVNLGVERQLTPAYYQGLEKLEFCVRGHVAKSLVWNANRAIIRGARAEGSRNLRKNELLGRKRAAVEDADVVLRIGRNPKKEAPVWNARIRSRLLQKGGPKREAPFRVARIGGVPDRTYPVEHLGHSTATVRAIVEGRHPFCTTLRRAEKPLILLGQSVREREDSEILWKLLRVVGIRVAGEAGLAQGFGTHWFPSSVGHANAAYVGIGELLTERYIAPSRTHYKRLAWSVFDLPYHLVTDLRPYRTLDSERTGLWAINAQLPLNWRSSYWWVTYQGSHGDSVCSSSGAVRPGASVTEEQGTNVDLEGVRKVTQPLHDRPGEARENWAIVKARVEEVYRPWSTWNLRRFGTKEEIRHVGDRAEHIQKTYGCREHGGRLETKVLTLPASLQSVAGLGRCLLWKGSGRVFLTPLIVDIENYFRSDRLSTFSPTRAKCTLASSAVEKETAFTVSIGRSVGDRLSVIGRWIDRSRKVLGRILLEGRKGRVRRT